MSLLLSLYLYLSLQFFFGNVIGNRRCSQNVFVIVIVFVFVYWLVKSSSAFASRDPCAVQFLCAVSDFRSKCIPRSFSNRPQTASTSLNLIQMHAGSSGLTSVQGREEAEVHHETHPMSFDPAPALNFSKVSIQRQPFISQISSNSCPFYMECTL